MDVKKWKNEGKEAKTSLLNENLWLLFNEWIVVLTINVFNKKRKIKNIFY
jgi:hypothetical protein